METDGSISLELPPPPVLYIQALYRRGSDGEQVVSKWYKIPDPGPSSSSNVQTCSDGKFLAPVFDGPPNGLRSCASVASGSTIYVTGGIEHSKLEENCDLMPSDILTNRVYFRDVVSDFSWKEGPPMIKHRAGHHAALVNGKIYVFGSTFRICEPEGGPPWETEYRWSPWAECLDRRWNYWAWERMPDPPGLGYGHSDVASGHASFDHGKQILVYCKPTDLLEVYDTECDSWWSEPTDRCYHVVTSMDGILYGAEHVDWGFETIYALKIPKKPYMPFKGHTPVKNLEMIPGPVLPSGLIPLGQEVLCVLTGYRSTTDNLFKICCSNYRIRKPTKLGLRDQLSICQKELGKDDGLSTTAQLLSRSNYYLKDVISVEGCLLMPHFEAREDHCL